MYGEFFYNVFRLGNVNNIFKRERVFRVLKFFWEGEYREREREEKNKWNYFGKEYFSINMGLLFIICFVIIFGIIFFDD